MLFPAQMPSPLLQKQRISIWPRESIFSAPPYCPGWSSKTLLLYLPTSSLQNKGTAPHSSSPPFGPSAPKDTQSPQKHQCIPTSFSGDLWARLQPSLPVCQRGNPLSRPICPSPAFPGCLRVLWDEGWVLSLPPPSLSPSGCCSVWPQTRIAPFAPQGQSCP